MSVEELELGDLLTQTLEKNGSLSKIRAQLRANVFLTLKEDLKIEEHDTIKNHKLNSYFDKPEGHIMFSIVKEFLDFFDLEYTLSVFEPETRFGNFYKFKNRQKLVEQLGLSTYDATEGPVLLHLIKAFQTNDVNTNSERDLNNSTSNVTFENGTMSDQSEVILNGHNNNDRLHKTFTIETINDSHNKLDMSDGMQNDSTENMGKVKESLTSKGQITNSKISQSNNEQFLDDSERDNLKSITEDLSSAFDEESLSINELKNDKRANLSNSRPYDNVYTVDKSHTLHSSFLKTDLDVIPTKRANPKSSDSLSMDEDQSSYKSNVLQETISDSLVTTDKF